MIDADKTEAVMEMAVSIRKMDGGGNRTVLLTVVENDQELISLGEAVSQAAGVRQPGSDARQPNSDVQQSGDDARQFGADERQLSSDIQQPGVDKQQLSSDPGYSHC
ncbi:MAG: hypothetical protein GX940_03710 [Clostridiaceae bacterium]|jgi:hypothetical protein|nr:hypothetical protein [Clostridiaceae bacterium]